MTLVIRTVAEPMSLAAAVRRELVAVDQDQPVYNLKSMERVLSESISARRFIMWLLGLFAAIALILAAMGIYGVTAYLARQRTRELGIRISLGAQKRDILWLVVGRGVMLILPGITIGLAAGLSLTRFLSSVLFKVSATDPTTLITMSCLLSSVSLLACYLPARRAARLDPMLALRYE